MQLLVISQVCGKIKRLFRVKEKKLRGECKEESLYEKSFEYGDQDMVEYLLYPGVGHMTL